MSYIIYSLEDDKNIFAYQRSWKNKSWLILVNMTEKDLSLNELHDNLKNYKKIILHNYLNQKLEDILKPYEAYILEK